MFGVPLVTGDAIDARQAYGEVPGALARCRGRRGPRHAASDRRVAVLPGELFGYYRWGDTMDPVGPALSERPLLVREIVPYADRRSSQFQEVVDDLVQQDRLVPGQLERLLRLMGAGSVLVPADGRPERSGALDPARAERAFSEEPWLRRPARSYGPPQRVVPARGWGGDPLDLPALRRFRLADADDAVRVHLRGRRDRARRGCPRDRRAGRPPGAAGGREFATRAISRRPSCAGSWSAAERSS